jgi:hypothetical protein
LNLLQSIRKGHRLEFSRACWPVAVDKDEILL